MKKGVVVGIGEVLWDMFPGGKQLGGAPANFAFHVMKQGVRSCVVSAVGNDKLGDEIVDALQRKGVQMDISRVMQPTGTVKVEIDGNGVPCYEITKDAAWDNIPYDEELEALANKTTAVCFGTLAQRSGISQATIKRFIETTSSDTLKVFDINLRQQFYGKQLIEASLKLCNLLKINDEELAVLANLLVYELSDYESMCKRLINEYDLRAVILTCGENGSHVVTDAGQHSFLPTPRVEVVDTVGAGDSFTAAFVASMLKGKSVETAHRNAVELAAHVCMHRGAMP